jgi:hypothetical protein
VLKGKEGEKNAGRRRKEGVVVVGKRKPNKKSASGPAGFGPQAQRVKVCGQC